jgi:hypothetical protein
MEVSNDLNMRVADELASRIDNMLNADPDLTQREIFTACLMVMCGALASIECPDCRRINVKMLKQEWARMIKAALDYNAEEINIGSSEHVH